MTSKKAKRDTQGGKRDSGKRDSLARARTLRVLSRCHAVTSDDRDVTVGRDKSLARPVTPGKSRMEEHRAELAADPRFAAWAAGWVGSGKGGAK